MPGAKTYQRTHPRKTSLGHKDADATLASPMVLGVADGVSQLEEFGMDASELPRELLRVCEDLGMNQLIPDRPANPQDAYRGPVSLLKEAYEETESREPGFGSEPRIPGLSLRQTLAGCLQLFMRAKPGVVG
ncbi:unnamed protein product [Effrenium voratum]|nr:unnamed protein product [Effrenium voratum]